MRFLEEKMVFDKCWILVDILSSVSTWKIFFLRKISDFSRYILFLYSSSKSVNSLSMF